MGKACIIVPLSNIIIFKKYSPSYERRNFINTSLLTTHISKKGLKSEPGSDLVVMRVLRTDPIGVLCLQLVPSPVSQIAMEQAIGMESITPLNHILWSAALLEPSHKNLGGWEFVVNNIEILKGMFSHDFLVNL